MRESKPQQRIKVSRGGPSRKWELILNLSFFGAWYAVALALFFRAEGISPAWRTQGIALILLTALMAAAIPFLKERRGLTILLAVKFLLVFLLSYPLGENLYLRMLFQTPILFEAVLYLPLPWGAILATVSLPVFLFIPRSVSAWGAVLPTASPWEIGFSLLFQGLLVLFLTRYRYQGMILRKREEQAELLNEALRKVIDTNMDYQSYASSVKETTLEEERKRVSRELHDIIGYTLTNQLMITQAARSFKQEDRSKLNDLLEKAERNLREGLSEARAALRQLRAETAPGSHGLKLFIKLVDNFREVTGIDVKLELTSINEGLPPLQEKVLYRILQEGMTNAFRHGEATEIRIILGEDVGGYDCLMRDNGRGAGKVEEGIGLAGMKERVESLGGILLAGPAKDGFTLQCRLPKGDISD